MAVSAFGTSPRCAASCLTRAKGIPRAATEDAQPGAAPPECVVPLLPHPIPSWEVGNGKDLSVGRQECPSQPCHPLPHSALLQGDAPSPGEALREKRDSWGWFFGCLVLLRVEESQIPCTFPKMYQGAGTSLVHPWLPGGFSVLFFFSFFLFSRESRQNQKEAPVLIKTNKILYILVEFYTQLRWGWVTAEHRALSQDQDITTLETVVSMKVREFPEWTKLGPSVEM